MKRRFAHTTRVPVERTQLWSFGGGVQSAAIAALIVKGDLPCPDIAVIADTAFEKASTWAYLDDVIAPALFGMSAFWTDVYRRVR